MTKRRRKPLTPDVQFRISSAGGKQAWELGRAHRFTHEEAVAAGKKGAQARLMNLKLAKDLKAAVLDSRARSRP